MASSAQQKALENLVAGQSMSLEPPSGEMACPLGRIRIGVFFDGTGNNMWRDWGNQKETLAYDKLGKNGPTNVAKLFECYLEPTLPIRNKVYHHGVGADKDYEDKNDVSKEETSRRTNNAPSTTTKFGNGLKGGGFGYGGKERIKWGLKQLASFYSKGKNDIAPEKLFDVFGFSRGAALARDFVNAVKATGVQNLNKPIKTTFMQVGGENGITNQFVPFEIYEMIPWNTITPSFMGIFDTVDMFDTGDVFKLHVDHTYVEHVLHMVAEDEFRMLFPLTSLFMDPNDKDDKTFWKGEPTNKAEKYQDPRWYKKWMLELWYPGCHSDLGGSYLARSEKPAVPPRKQVVIDDFGGVHEWMDAGEPAVPGKRRELAHIPLTDMHTACVKLNVPMGPLSKIGAHMYIIPKDLADAYGAYVAFRAKTDYAQHTEKDNSRYIHSYEDSEYRKRFYTETRYKDYLQPWNWHKDDAGARESQQCVKDLQIFIHDSSLEFGLTGWAEKKFIQTRLQRKVIYSDAQPVVAPAKKASKGAGVRTEHLPKPNP